MGIPSPKLKMGGPTTHLPYLVKHFENNIDFDIRTFEFGSKRDGGSQIHNKEGMVTKVLNTLGTFSRFVCHVILYRPDIIHINTAFDRKTVLRDIPFSIFCFLFGRKLIFKIHGSSNLIHSRSRIYRYLIKLFFLGASKVGVLSDIERKEFIEHFGNVHKLIVVKNIVSGKTITDKHFFSKIPDKTYALFVSRIIEGKGLEDAINSLPLILKTSPEFVLIVAGDGPELRNCMDLAKEKDLNNSIHWLGYISNNEIPALILSSDIFLFLSHLPEGMPMALVEALKYGIPVITTKVRFALNYLKDRNNCLFIEAGDINDISEKINLILTDIDLQNKMKMQNPKLAEYFNSEKVGTEFEMVYRNMIN